MENELPTTRLRLSVMSPDKSITALKPGSERSFGVVFTIVFALIALYPIVHGGGILWWGLIVSAAILVLTIVRPTWLAQPNYWWFRFGILLGGIVAPVVLAIVYITTIVPTGLVMRALRKDPLRLNLRREQHSYWMKRESILESMKNQF